MSVQSASYLMILAVVWGLTTAMGCAGRRQLLLLAFSYIFYYSWSTTFTLLLLSSSVFNYAWGGLVRRRPHAYALIPGLGINISVLILFKYATDFIRFIDGSEAAENWLSSSVMMPIGLSFYTFQAISYLVDVYRGLKNRPTLIEFMLYMAFWPTVLSGPICRAGELIPQFRGGNMPSWDDVAVGTRRIILGLFMKVVVADTLRHGLSTGEGLDAGFDHFESGWSGLDIWFLAVGFGFQLFFDFAGYSHIAIGSARLFGIRLRENFNDPYLSRTPTEFWNRWHMSLSTWIRDYLFFPLATLRRDMGWRNLALVISMTIFGVWHGVGMTFLLWGIYHGLLLVAHRQVQQLHRTRLQGLALPGWAGSFLSWASTFILVSLGWIIFRANSPIQAGRMIGALFSPGTYTTLSLSPNFCTLVVLTVCGYFIYVASRELFRHLQTRPVVAHLVWWASPVSYATAILLVIIWSKQGSSFVYFQF